MTAFWKGWLRAWCVAVGGFGAVLATGALPATEGVTRALLDVLNGPQALEVDATLRFSLGVLGAVTLGWAVTLATAIAAAHRLGADGAAVWAGLTGAVLTWFVVDSVLSAATGFALNIAPNVLFTAAYLLPVLRSGVLRRGPTLRTATASERV